jgi:hypothetical protein
MCPHGEEQGTFFARKTLSTTIAHIAQKFGTSAHGLGERRRVWAGLCTAIIFSCELNLLNGQYLGKWVFGS